MNINVGSLERKSKGLDEKVRNRMIQKAILIRKLEEKLLELFSKGELYGTVHTCIGQEFTGVIVSEFVEQGDTIFSNHRCHGHFISITNDAKGLISEIYGKATGVCGGRGGSQHLYKEGFYSNGVQGGMVPISAGFSLANKLRCLQKISIVFIGDGTLGEGVLYEVLNIASKWNLPILFVLENNLYAQSTHQSETLAGNICSRAIAFNINTDIGSTQDWEELYFKIEKAVKYVRRDSKPLFFQIDTYRLKAHSKGDDTRDKNEIKHFEDVDPLNHILKKDKDSIKVEKWLAEAEGIVNLAVEFARSSKSPVKEHFVNSNGVNYDIKFQLYNMQNNQKYRMSSAINTAFKYLMEKNNRVLCIGEDVKSPYGGAFKISLGLSDLFPDRVINTPISEAAIVGIATGLAMKGFCPFVEIMFGDFITLAFDQILNHASKFNTMFNDQVHVPLIIRTPMGGGRGYGPTHSQTLEKHFLGIPGLTILAVNNLIEPKVIYETLIENNNNPVLLIENKLLYTKYVRTEPPKGFNCIISNEKYPSIVISPKSGQIDLTLIGYGNLGDLLVDAMEKLFYEHEIISQLICPIQIYPFSIIPFMDIIPKGKFLLLIEEGQQFAGFGSEIIAQIAEYDSSRLLNLKRIGSPNTLIPASKSLETKILPNIESIIQSILEGFYENNNSRT
uniref:RenH n=1 Tax=Candidatus Endohaliclona renieramycinifaciens TaxID=2565582 RepID=A0A4D6G3B4_9GAMM|nr:RenH [Candidatus Endohaliclona renieramycinifaciens]